MCQRFELCRSELIADCEHIAQVEAEQRSHVFLALLD